MENCINCNKQYTIRGMKLHRNKCDKVYILIKEKEELKKEKELKKIKIVYSHQKIFYIFNYLHDDCVKIIYQYLLLKDQNTSYYKLYNDINNVSFVCKNFYLNRPNIQYMKEKIYMEMNETICRAWSKDIYGLKDEELEYLDYKIVSRGWNYTMHLFNIIDVKELAYKKYGTEYDYRKYLDNKIMSKLLSKKEKDIIIKKRKDLYDNLFEKYDYKNNSYLHEVYEFYIDYIKKGFPTIITIEKEIKNSINKILLKNNLIIELIKRNINYFENNIVIYYINGNTKYSIDIVIESLNKRMIKQEKYKNLYKDEYSIIAYKYINDDNKDIDDLINLIHNLELIYEHMDYNKKINTKNLCDEKNIEDYLDNVIQKWCNINKNNDIQTFNFINELDHLYQKKIKNHFLIFEQEKEKILNKNLLREKIINNFKNGIKNKETLFCFCDNIGSFNCINYLCKKCCNNNNCKKHGKHIYIKS